MENEKRVLAVVFSEKDLMNKVTDLKEQGFDECDIHVVTRDSDRLDEIEGRTGAEGKRVDSFKDKFKSFITGESSVREGVKTLGLSDQETERYTADLARGGILLYTEDENPEL